MRKPTKLNCACCRTTKAVFKVYSTRNNLETCSPKCQSTINREVRACDPVPTIIDFERYARRLTARHLTPRAVWEAA
jgi:hypothetical protein